MILYSTVPNDIVMSLQPESDTKLIRCKGTLLSVKQAQNSIVTERILSTNPKDYLNGYFSPGKVINIK